MLLLQDAVIWRLRNRFCVVWSKINFPIAVEVVDFYSGRQNQVFSILVETKQCKIACISRSFACAKLLNYLGFFVSAVKMRCGGGVFVLWFGYENLSN
jgi:hypothetical protein